jgi:hypothetical protein
MTKDDILKLAQDSYERGQSDLIESCKEAAVKAIESAILAEREACAKLFDGPVWSYDYREIAAAIRARGQA